MRGAEEEAAPEEGRWMRNGCVDAGQAPMERGLTLQMVVRRMHRTSACTLVAMAGSHVHACLFVAQVATAATVNSDDRSGHCHCCPQCPALQRMMGTFPQVPGNGSGADSQRLASGRVRSVSHRDSLHGRCLAMLCRMQLSLVLQKLEVTQAV
jgi:hypothetical protein